MSGPGKPRLREGEETVVVRARIPEADKDLARRGAERVGESLSEYLRGALVQRALDDLGLSIEAYLESAEERRDPGGRRCWRCGRPDAGE